jgi:predicted RNA polymerase sigma factor
MGAFEVCWTGDIAGPPEAVWDAITVHSGGWLWPIRYEPRVGGVEDGLSSDGGVVEVWPDEREVQGLLALLLVHEARRDTRTDAAGRVLRLADQDRSRWDGDRIAEADRLVVAALRAGR